VKDFQASTHVQFRPADTRVRDRYREEYPAPAGQLQPVANGSSWAVQPTASSISCDYKPLTQWLLPEDAGDRSTLFLAV